LKMAKLDVNGWELGQAKLRAKTTEIIESRTAQRRINSACDLVGFSATATFWSESMDVRLPLRHWGRGRGTTAAKGIVLQGIPKEKETIGG